MRKLRQPLDQIDIQLLLINHELNKQSVIIIVTFRFKLFEFFPIKNSKRKFTLVPVLYKRKQPVPYVLLA